MSPSEQYDRRAQTEASITTSILKPPLPNLDPEAASLSAHKVFHINVFEYILLNVDNKTLLLSQRVDSHWKINITNSRLLQKKLFLLSATMKDLPRLNIVEQAHRPRNAPTDPDDADAQRSWLRDKLLNHNVSELRGGPWRGSNTGVGQVVIHNPLLLKRVYGGFGEVKFLSPSWESSSIKDRGPLPSCMKMLLLQPPPHGTVRIADSECGYRVAGDILLGSLEDEIGQIWPWKIRHKKGRRFVPEPSVAWKDTGFQCDNTRGVKDVTALGLEIMEDGRTWRRSLRLGQGSKGGVQV